MSLATILEEHVFPYAASPNQLNLHGEMVELNEDVAFDLAMVIHELATNAAKYGALATPDGRVDIVWIVDDASGNLELTWRESGGPPVDPPERQGLGSSLIAGFSSGETAPPNIEFNEEGIVWQAQISASEFRVVDSAR